MSRRPLSKRLRFQVLQRDDFTCQYCGASAPDVVLHVDHKDAVAQGGGNDLANLITACFDCNMGKRDDNLLPTPVNHRNYAYFGWLVAHLLKSVRADLIRSSDLQSICDWVVESEYPHTVVEAAPNIKCWSNPACALWEAENGPWPFGDEEDEGIA
jgi:hypothetical protein